MTHDELLDERRAAQSFAEVLCSAIAARGRVVAESLDDAEVLQLDETSDTAFAAVGVPPNISRGLQPSLSKLDVQLVPAGTFHARGPHS